MRFGGCHTFGMAIVQDGVVKMTWHTSLVVVVQSAHEGVDIQAQFLRQLGQGLRNSAFKHGRHETAHGFGIGDGVANLPGLLGHQTTPNGIALGPKVFAFVVETLGVFVHHHTQGHTVNPRANAAVIERCTCINGHHVRLCWVANLISALVEQMLEQSALVELGAANQEVVGGVFTLCVLTPSFFQPLQIGLEAACGHDTRFGGHALCAQHLTLR